MSVITSAKWRLNSIEKLLHNRIKREKSERENKQQKKNEKAKILSLHQDVTLFDSCIALCLMFGRATTERKKSQQADKKQNLFFFFSMKRTF